MCASWNAPPKHSLDFGLVYAPKQTELNKVLTSHVKLAKSHGHVNFYQKTGRVLLDFESY